jgi:predicted Zn-dependent protease
MAVFRLIAGDTMRIIVFVLLVGTLHAAPHREPSQNYQDYLLGCYHLACERPQEAFDHYQPVLKSANSPYPYEGQLQLLAAAGQYKAIVPLIAPLDKPFSENLPVQLIFIQALYETGNEQQADARAITLQKKFKKSPELTFLAAQAHGKGSPVQGLEVIEEFLNNVPFQQRHCLFYYLQSKLYEQLNNREKALELAQKSVALCPHLQRRSVLSGMLKQQREQVQASQVSVIPPHRPTEQRLQRTVLQQGNKPRTLRLTENCIQDSAFLFEKKQYDAALSNLDKCLLQAPEHEQARLLKIQILTAQGNNKKAADLLKGWLDKEPTNQAWYQALYWLTYTGISRKQVIQLLLGLEQKNKKNLHIQLYLADLYGKIDDIEAALAYHGKARTLCDCPKLKTKILCNEGLLHFEQARFAIAKQLLKQAEQLQEPFAPLENLLAYFYATKELNIPLAQAHIAKALQIDPRNSNYLDTQAIIWYREGNYEKAAHLLEKLVIKEPKNYAMHLHLAKIYDKLAQTRKSALHAHQAKQLAQTKRQKSAYQQLVKLFP